MKKMIAIIFTMFFVTNLCAPSFDCAVVFRGKAINPYDKLWDAICQVESNNNPLAYNPHEGAVGIAQVRSIRLRHYNTLTRKNLSMEMMYDPLKAKEVFMFFASGSYEMTARKWNGSGRKTIEYWKKVRGKL